MEPVAVEKARTEKSGYGGKLHRSIGWQAHAAAGGCLLLYLSCFVFLLATQRPAFREADFASFYLVGRMLLERPPAELFDLDAQRAFQEQIGSFSFKPYIHPPFEAFLFLPFALLRYETALWVWFGVNFLALAVLPWVLPRVHPAIAVQHPLVLALCILSFYPFYACLLNGQDSILFLWVLLLLFSKWSQGNDRFVGVLLGLSFIKPHLAVLIAMPVLWRQMRQKMIGLALCCGLLWVTSALWLGPGWTASYLSLLKEVGSHGSNPSDSSVQIFSEVADTSARAHLKQLPVAMHNWIGQLSDLGFDQMHGFLGAGALALFVLLLNTCIWKPRAAELDRLFPVRFASMVLLALLASFHLYMHDLAIAFLPLFLSFEYAFSLHGPIARAFPILLGVSVMVWMYPVIPLGGLNLKTTVLWMSCVLVVTLVLLFTRGSVAGVAAGEFRSTLRQ